MPAEIEQSLKLLSETLADTRATIRAYDTKAQIVGVGYLFALAAIGRFEENFMDTIDITLLGVVAFWTVIIMPVMLFGAVLYPTRKSAPRLSAEAEAKPEHVLYVNPTEFETAEALKQAVGRCDPLDETAYELIKASKLRELKRKRFIRGLIVSAVAFALIFASHFSQHI